MNKPKIYLETTIFNFPFADDAPQLKADTNKLFSEIKAGRYEPYTSAYAIEELNDTEKIDKLIKMKELIEEYNIKIIPVSGEVERLAALYLTEGGNKQEIHYRCLAYCNNCGK